MPFHSSTDVILNMKCSNRLFREYISITELFEVINKMKKFETLIILHLLTDTMHARLHKHTSCIITFC